jgi:predicted amidohydrolase
MPSRAALRLALLEFASEVGDKHANLELALEMLAQAAARRVRLAVLPELWNTGYLAGRLFPKLAEPIPGPTTKALAQFAKDARMAILAGSLPEKGRGRTYNTAVLLDAKGKIVLGQRKVHLWTTYERRWFARGRGFAVAKTPFAVVGAMVCYDGDFPEVPRVLALRGATLLLHPAAYPETGREDWDLLYPAHARANGVFVVGANHVGWEDGTYAKDHWPRGVAFGGGSQVIDPLGGVLYRADRDDPAVHVVDIDMREVARARKASNFLAARVPEAYRGLTTRPRARK